MKYTKEIEKKENLCHISHPDAGKTTLTEKFLLYGGALIWPVVLKERQRPHAVSDWMEIEKERGYFRYFFRIAVPLLTVTASTFWILLDIRISQRILIVP